MFRSRRQVTSAALVTQAVRSLYMPGKFTEAPGIGSVQRGNQGGKASHSFGKPGEARSRQARINDTADEVLPAPNLVHTEVGQGTMHTPFDMYHSLEPNLPSKSTESTTIMGAQHIPVHHRGQLERSRQPLSAWFGPDGQGSLKDYLLSLKIDCAPLSSASQKLLASFEEGLVGAGGNLPRQWADLIAQVFEQRAEHVFNIKAFVSYVSSFESKVTTFLDQSHFDELSEIFDILRRNAIALRNQGLDHLIAVAEASSNRAGHAVWSRFFALVNVHRADLIEANDVVKAMWELSQSSDLPEPSAPVALLFAIVTAAHAPNLETTGEASTIHSAQTTQQNRPDAVIESVKHCTDQEMFDFIRNHVAKVVDRPSDVSGRVFSQYGMYEQYQTISAVVAAVDEIKLARSESMKTLIPYFKDKKFAHNVAHGLLSGKDVNVAAFIAKALGMNSAKADLQPHLEKLHWESVYEEFARAVLGNEDATQALRQIIDRTVKGGQHTKVLRAGSLFTDEVLAALDTILALQKRQMHTVEDRLKWLRRSLLIEVSPYTVLRAFGDLGVDLTPLVEVSQQREAANRREPPAITGYLMRAVVGQIGAVHPKWTTTPIAPTASLSSSDNGAAGPPLLRLSEHSELDAASSSAVDLLLRMFLRMTYVPHAGHALLKQRYRGRIGPVATEPHQVNLDVEVGVTERIDEGKYKRWDQAGWYQRMMDIHNRNVSLRADLKDLRRLDNEGKPYIDMQTERRLRILADDRVGNGVVKLDSDRFEDQKDNLEFGQVAMQELMAEAKKAQLGKEYWPSVEVKVRRPSGQSKMHYSLLDWNRVEAASKANFKRYIEAKKTNVYVSPTDVWLKTRGTTARAQTTEDTSGYSAEQLFGSMDDESDD